MKRIPITIVTGFLGSGKTTFLNRVLAENKDKRIGLLLNEFGSISLESEFIVSEPGGIVEFDGGCLCHAPLDQIINSIQQILALKNSVNHIVIEASGLTNPLPVMQLINSPELKHLVALDTIICLVDTKNFAENSKHRILMQGQLLYSNYVILTKTDLLHYSQVKVIQKQLMEWASDLNIIDIKKLSSTKLLLSNPQDFSFLAKDEDINLEQIEHEHEHSDFSIEIIVHPGEVDVGRITRIIGNAPSSITRIKAVLYSEVPARHKWLVHKVGSVIETKRIKINPEKNPVNKILLVGVNIPQDFFGQLKHIVVDLQPQKSMFRIIKNKILSSLGGLSTKVEKLK